MTLHIDVYRDGEVLTSRTVNERPILIGTAPHNDLIVEGVSWHQALLWNEDGTLWIKNLGDANLLKFNGSNVEKAMAITSDAEIHLADTLALSVRPSKSKPASAIHPYRLTVDLQASTGPEAILEDLETGRTCLIRSNNRVSVLYLLAKELVENPKKPDRERGWCQDQAVASGVWGRNWQKQIKSHLHVLVHRIRKDIKTAGLDPWCLEKKRCHTRMTIKEAVIK